MLKRSMFSFKTFQLWQGLLNPPESSPIFQRVLDAPLPIPPITVRGTQILRPLLKVLDPLARIVAAVIAPVLLPILSNLTGFLFAYYCAAFISRERERGTYDLLALTPAGEWDTTWTICLASVHRFRLLGQINFVRVMAVLGMILLAFPLTVPNSEWVIGLVIVGIALQLDAMQSVIVGCLCGMLGQTYPASAANAGISGAALFGAAQILCVYLPSASLIALIVATPSLRFINPHLINLAVVLTVLLHEIVIRVLWGVLRNRLQ